MILHHKNSLEEVVVGGHFINDAISLDPLVPALVVCRKMAVLKLHNARLSHKNMLTALEELPKLQELVLEDVSVEGFVSDRLCLCPSLVQVCLHTIVL